MKFGFLKHIENKINIKGNHDTVSPSTNTTVAQSGKTSNNVSMCSSTNSIGSKKWVHISLISTRKITKLGNYQ